MTAETSIPVIAGVLQEYYGLKEFPFRLALDPALDAARERDARLLHLQQTVQDHADVSPAARVQQLTPACRRDGDRLLLSFDPGPLIQALRTEAYLEHPAQPHTTTDASLLHRLYYALRPALPVAVRRQLQRYALRDWQRLCFPRWPVDTTVDDVLQELYTRLAHAAPAGQLPAIDFWPDGCNGCCLLTHDVETARGLARLDDLLALNRRYGFPAAVQLVPQQRYRVTPDTVRQLQQQGCEVNLHGLSHDGRLFSSREIFQQRCKTLQQLARTWGARGFRSPVLYRRAAWLEELGLEYDLSFPSVAHLDPQRGGCCTVHPYRLGRLWELPLTTTQDYTLLHILRQPTLELWKRQLEAILHKHGLASFNIHPDYLNNRRARTLYESLLQELDHWCSAHNIWRAQPGEVVDWLNARAKLRLIRHNGALSIQGEAASRARIVWYPSA